MAKQKRLGQGLAALLGAPLEEIQGNPEPSALDSPASASSPPPAANSDFVELEVHLVDENPFQPRQDFSDQEISSLAESLKSHDMLQPILVRPDGDRFQLISGERRLRAAVQAGWEKVPARIREADDRVVAELAIVENLQRKDLNPIEKAASFRRYLDEHQVTQEELAKRLSIDRSTIANLMRLLELPEFVLDAIRDGKVSAGHARALLPLGNEIEQVDFCRQIQQDGLSVRATERAVAEAIQDEDRVTSKKAAGAKKKRGTSSTNIAALEQELRNALGAKVEIKETGSGRGKITIQFANHDEFERLRTLLVDSGGEEIQRMIG